jgi:Deoxyribodipyrimidine photolyase
MKHLYDGDAASNTLGWRWVAGIQTPGKHYLASEWNIKKFTENRFQNIKLNENTHPKISEKSYSIIKKDFKNPQILEGKNLLIFENNLSFEITDFQKNNFKKIYVVSNKNENRSIKLSEKSVKFKSLLINDQEQRLKDKSIDCEIVDISQIKNIENCYSLYPTVGENLDYLNFNNLKIDFLYRKLDQISWQYCSKGFFNFKNYIPKIISTFN